MVVKDSLSMFNTSFWNWDKIAMTAPTGDLIKLMATKLLFLASISLAKISMSAASRAMGLKLILDTPTPFKIPSTTFG